MRLYHKNVHRVEKVNYYVNLVHRRLIVIRKVNVNDCLSEL